PTWARSELWLGVVARAESAVTGSTRRAGSTGATGSTDAAGSPDGAPADGDSPRVLTKPQGLPFSLVAFGSVAPCDSAPRCCPSHAAISRTAAPMGTSSPTTDWAPFPQASHTWIET